MACREVISSFSMPSAAATMSMFSDTQVSCRSERQAEAKAIHTHMQKSQTRLPIFFYAIPVGLTEEYCCPNSVSYL